MKKPVDYITKLYESEKKTQQKVGEKLKAQYEKWTRTLALKDFLEFADYIKTNRNEIGVAQFFGKFRAYSFEEYVYRLIKEKIHIKKPLKLFWGEKCQVWQNKGKNYAVEFDISIGMKKDMFVDPAMVFDTKIELDSSRLKTALASFAMLKKWKPDVKCAIVYVIRDLDSSLLELAMNWTDGIFQFSHEKDETEAFIGYVTQCLKD